MAYYVKKYCDGSRHVVRVRDGISDALKRIAVRVRETLGRALDFCVSRLQGAEIGKKISDIFRAVIDRIRRGEKESESAESGNGDMSTARRNLIDALKGLSRARTLVERSNLTPDIQIGLKSPIGRAQELMERIANDFSIQRILRNVNLMSKNNVHPALSYDPRVVISLAPTNATSTLLSGKTIHNAIMRRIAKIPYNVAGSLKSAISQIVSRASGGDGMKSAVMAIEGAALDEVKRVKNSLGGISSRHLPDRERKAFNEKINSVKKYVASVLDVLRRFSGHTGYTVPLGMKMFEQRVIPVPAKNLPLSAMHQGRLPFMKP